MKQGECICPPLHWSVHCNFVRDGKWSPYQPGLILPSWWNIRHAESGRCHSVYSEVDTGSKLTVGVVDTSGNLSRSMQISRKMRPPVSLIPGGKFSAGVNDTGGHLAAGVVETGGAPWAANIFASMKTCSTIGVSPLLECTCWSPSPEPERLYWEERGRYCT